MLGTIAAAFSSVSTILDRMQPAHEHADEAVRREPELFAQARAALRRRGAVHPEVDPVRETVKMRSPALPAPAAPPALRTLKAANHPHRIRSRALTAPSGFRARRDRSPQSPVPSTVTRHGSPSRRAPSAIVPGDSAPWA